MDKTQTMYFDSQEELINIFPAEQEPFTISGEQVKKILFLPPAKVVIVLIDGRSVVIEPDFYNEISLCEPGDYLCYIENSRIAIRFENGGADEL